MRVGIETVAYGHGGASEIESSGEEIVDTEVIAPPSGMSESLVIAEIYLIICLTIFRGEEETERGE